MNINLYLLTQDVNTNYNTYDSCVVAARNEEEARNINPDSKDGPESYIFLNWKPRESNDWNDWADSPEQVQVTYLGTAKKGTKVGVICASFNAG